MVSLPMIFGAAFSMLLAVGVPAAMLCVLRRKTGGGGRAALVGAACFVLFALVLEQLLHALVLPHVQGNVWLYCLYGCLAAGVFEETGRLAGLSLLCRGKHADPSARTGLGYGIGHVGIESILVGGLNMAVGLYCLIVVRAGGVLPASLIAAGDSAASTQAGLLWLAGVERMLALAGQLALSVIVWLAVTGRARFRWYFGAIGLHALLDVPAALGQTGVLTNMFVLEGIVAAEAAMLCLLAWSLYHRSEGRAVTPLPAAGPALQSAVPAVRPLPAAEISAPEMPAEAPAPDAAAADAAAPEAPAAQTPESAPASQASQTPPASAQSGSAAPDIRQL